MESIDLTKRFRCPVCGKYEFKFEGSFETCPICDWINDPLYDFRGANWMTLEEYKAEYEKKSQAAS